MEVLLTSNEDKVILDNIIEKINSIKSSYKHLNKSMEKIIYDPNSSLSILVKDLSGEDSYKIPYLVRDYVHENDTSNFITSKDILNISNVRNNVVYSKLEELKNLKKYIRDHRYSSYSYEEDDESYSYEENLKGAVQYIRSINSRRQTIWMVRSFWDDIGVKLNLISDAVNKIYAMYIRSSKVNVQTIGVSDYSKHTGNILVNSNMKMNYKEVSGKSSKYSFSDHIITNSTLNNWFDTSGSIINNLNKLNSNEVFRDIYVKMGIETVTKSNLLNYCNELNGLSKYIIMMLDDVIINLTKVKEGGFNFD